MLIPCRSQNLKGDVRPCHDNEGGVHERHGEGLTCREVGLRGGSGLDEVGRSFARRLVNP